MRPETTAYSPTYLRTKACAAALSIGVSTLHAWVARGVFPPPHRVNGVSLYPADVVKSFVEKEGRA